MCLMKESCCLDKKSSSLILGYLEKSKEKLRVAQLLLSQKAFEDAISRAYYAAFHAAQAALLTEGLTATTHQGVVNLFGLHFVKTGKMDKKFGRFLSNLKDDRENSDYEIYSSIDEDIAKNAVREAREFVNAIQSYLAPLL